MGGFPMPFWAAAVVFGLLLLAAYANTFRVPFIFDDRDSIVQNPTLRNFETVLFPPNNSGLTVSGRPVLNLTLAVNYALNGKDVTGYHVGNLLVHFLAALVLFGLVRRTLVLPYFKGRFDEEAGWTALTASVLWALHPLQTESVTYIIQRAESLVGLFFLLTMYCFVRSIELPRKWGWEVAAVAACFLGMGSKEVMAGAPLLVFLFDRTFVSGSFRAAWRSHRVLYVALAATWLLLAVCIVSTGMRGGTVGFFGLRPIWVYALTQCYAIFHYLGLVFWPNPLVMDYGMYLADGLADVWLQAMGLGLLLTATVWACWRKMAVGFLGAFFFIVLAPSSSVVPVITQTIAEHRMYLASAPVIVGMAIWLQHRWGRLARSVLFAVVVGLMALTFLRNQDYRSVTSIWSDAAHKRPDNFRAWFALGYAYADEEKYEEGKAQFERALEIQTGDVDALIGLASMLNKLGRLTESLDVFRQALKDLPDKAPAAYTGYYNYGLTLVAAGMVDEGMANLRKALTFKNDFPEVHYGLGNAFVSKNQLPEAVAEFKIAVAAAPEIVIFRANLGNALIKMGRFADAIEAMRPGLSAEPKSAELRFNLGLAYMNLGQMKEARKKYEDALEVNPRFASAHVNLGLMSSGDGSLQEACDHFLAAIEAGEKNPVVYTVLGRSLLKLGRINEAIVQMNQAVKLAPDDLQLIYFLASALLQDSQWAAAAAQFEQVLARMPGLAEAHNGLGVAYQRLGRIGEARAEFREAIRLRSDFMEARQNLENLGSL